MELAMETANIRSQSGASPNMGLKMSPHALDAMRNTEKVMLKYYNDMGRKKGNCIWGIGLYAHKGVCTPEKLKRKVTAPSVEVAYVKRVTEAERRVKLIVRVRLTQAHVCQCEIAKVPQPLSGRSGLARGPA